jgi:hypothetical protein
MPCTRVAISALATDGDVIVMGAILLCKQGAAVRICSSPPSFNIYLSRRGLVRAGVATPGGRDG